MNRQIHWARILAEGTAIVVSILLAFGIQAWWEGHQDRHDEALSLELLVRDLGTTLSELEQFEQQMADQVALAAELADVLEGPTGPIDTEWASRALVDVTRRRTVDFSSAAYTDLVSTGTLRVIQDRALRDEITQFFQAAAQNQVVIEKNSTQLIDQLLVGFLAGEGWVFSSISWARGEVAVRDDPIWRMAPDSEPRRRLLGVLRRYAQGNSVSVARARGLADQGRALMSSIEEYLAAS